VVVMETGLCWPGGITRSLAVQAHGLRRLVLDPTAGLSPPCPTCTACGMQGCVGSARLQDVGAFAGLLYLKAA